MAVQQYAAFEMLELREPLAMSEIDQLRREQSDAVMPLIGPLLDQWEGMPKDAKSSLRWDYPTLCEYLDKINDAVQHS